MQSFKTNTLHQKTEYACVYYIQYNANGRFCSCFYYHKSIKGKIFISPRSNNTFTTAKDCALALDKKLIESGFEPINILKRKP